MELDERKKKIITAVVEQYIKTGEPVGSKGLLSLLDISVSSATVRNEMSELSEMGLLSQTHTSSGRIPTHKGYRYYVDELMKDRPLDDAQKRRLDLMMGRHFNDPEKLLEQAGEILADITGYAVISTTPTDEQAAIRKIELVPVSRKTAIVVLLTSTGILKNRICRTDAEITSSMISAFYTMAAENFIGKPLSCVETVMLQNLAVSFGDDSLAMTPIIVALADLAQDVARAEVLLEGQANLLHNHDIGPNVYELLEFLGRTEPLKHLLNSGKKTLDVVIGEENPYKQLGKSSLIIARYSVNGYNSGAFGVIGPTRMDYASLMPSVRYVTDLVGRLLSQTLEE